MSSGTVIVCFVLIFFINLNSYCDGVRIRRPLYNHIRRNKFLKGYDPGKIKTSYVGNVSFVHLHNELKNQGYRGEFYPRGTRGYEKYRIMQNGICNLIYPFVVIRPLDTKDVSAAMKVVRKLNLELSVRSGGHSYTCTGIKQDSVQFDMRNLNIVKHVGKANYGYLLHKRETLIRLGPGNTWERVLRHVPAAKYSMVHGQCLTVGVGGCLLGGCMNAIGTTMRGYGIGYEHVVEYTVVLASGHIARVTYDNVTYSDGYKTHVVKNAYGTNLFKMLKGAGGSFGIVTEFLYKVRHHAETKPIFVPLFIESEYDIKNLLNACNERIFDVHIADAYNLRIGKLMGGPVGRSMIGLMKMLGNSKTSISGGIFTEMDTYNRHSSIPRLLDLLNRHHIKLAIPYSLAYKVLRLDQQDFHMESYEMFYMTPMEMKQKGPQAVTSANVFPITSTKPVADLVLNFPVFGKRYSDILPPVSVAGCDYCFRVIQFINHREGTRPMYSATAIKSGQPSQFAIELTCMYDPYNKYRAKKCTSLVAQTREYLFKAVQKADGEVRQYVNTPTCAHPGATHFGYRYWGDNYPEMVQTKSFWDPDNVLNYCQSVGSQDETCCSKF